MLCCQVKPRFLEKVLLKFLHQSFYRYAASHCPRRFSTNPYEEFQFFTPCEPHFLVQKLLTEMEPYFEMFQEDSLKHLLAHLQADEAVAPKVLADGDIAFPIVKKPSIMKDLKQMYDEVIFQSKEHGLNAGENDVFKL